MYKIFDAALSDDVSAIFFPILPMYYVYSVQGQTLYYSAGMTPNDTVVVYILGTYRVSSVLT